VATAKVAPDAAGDCWTGTAICADTKISQTWLVGDRSAAAASQFIGDLAGQLASRV
jgi:hypothetical protein